MVHTEFHENSNAKVIFGHNAHGSAAYDGNLIVSIKQLRNIRFNLFQTNTLGISNL